MDPILMAILGAAAPVAGQLISLINLFISAKQKDLTVEEVQQEIDKIVKRRIDQDAEENAIAGVTG